MNKRKCKNKMSIDPLSKSELGSVSQIFDKNKKESCLSENSTYNINT